MTLAEALRGAGYRSACFGKWHNGEQYPYTPQGQGFEEFFGFNNGHWNNYFDAVLLRGAKPEPTQGYITDVLTDEAMKFIAGNKAAAVLLLPRLQRPALAVPGAGQVLRQIQGQGLRRHVAAFYGMCENLDDNVGRLLAQLDRERARGQYHRPVPHRQRRHRRREDSTTPGCEAARPACTKAGRACRSSCAGPRRNGTPHVVKPIVVPHRSLPHAARPLRRATRPPDRRWTGSRCGRCWRTTDSRRLARARAVHPQPHRRNEQVPRRRAHPALPPGARDQGPGGGSKAKANDASATPWQLYDMENDPGQEQRHRRSASRHREATQRALRRLVRRHLARRPAAVPAARRPCRSTIPWNCTPRRPTSTRRCISPMRPGLRQRLAHRLDGCPTRRCGAELEVTQAGDYEIEIAFGAPPADAGSRIRVSAGGETVDLVVPAAEAKEIPLPHRDDEGKRRYRNREWATLNAGTLSLPQGPAKITLEPLTVPGMQVMDLKHIQLKLHPKPSDR